MSPAQ